MSSNIPLIYQLVATNLFARRDLLQSHAVTDPGHAHPQNITANFGACTGSGINYRDLFSDAGTDACPIPQGASTISNTTGLTVQSIGGGETRPINVSVDYIIKL